MEVVSAEDIGIAVRPAALSGTGEVRPARDRRLARFSNRLARAHLAAPFWRSPAFPLAAGAALAPMLAVLQSLTMAPLAVSCLLLCVLAARREDGTWPLPKRCAATWAGFGLAGWGALSATWAIEPWRALLAAGQLAGLVLLAGAAARAVLGRTEGAALIGRALLLGLPAGLLLALADHWSGNAVRMAVRGLERAPPGLEFGLKPAAAVMALLLPLVMAVPVAGSAARAGRFALLGGGLAALLLLPGDTPKLAGLAGVGTALLAARWPARARPVVVALAAGLVLGGPSLAGVLAGVGSTLAERLPFSAAHRLLIWDYALSRSAERPLLGWGMEASRALPGGRAAPDIAALDRLGMHGPELRARFTATGVEALPLHPHNGALQVLLELGWPGLMLAAGLAAGVALAAPSAAVLGAVLAGLASSLLSFGAWQPWWLAAEALAAALAVGLVVDRAGRVTAVRSPN